MTAASHLEDQTRAIERCYHEHSMTRSTLEAYLKTAREVSGMLLTNLLRAANLIKSFKQVAVDQTSEEKRIFKLKECIDDVLLSLRPELKKTQLPIAVSCPDHLELESYPGSFAQIFTNFVMNSLIHAFAPGNSGEIALHIREQHDTLWIRYSDNGKGMSPHERSQIFEPFYTTKRGQGGSGLGLHIVYNLVTQRLNGSIACESAPGEGTTFVIHLPLVE